HCSGALLKSAAQNRRTTTSAIVARDYAEALDVAVAQPGAWCSSSYTVSYTPPAGYSVTPTPAACPVNNATTPQSQPVAILVTAPSPATESLPVVVRKP